ANDFFPCANDLFFAQQRLTFQFCRQFIYNCTDCNGAIDLFVGLGQSAPLFNESFAKIGVHKKTGQFRGLKQDCPVHKSLVRNQLSPSLPMASTGHPSIASLQSSSSSAPSGCL